MELGLTERDRRAVVSSRDIAQVFEKRHADVMRDIRTVIENDPEWGMYNFGETPYVEPQNGQTYTEFYMNRDGFTILVILLPGDWDNRDTYQRRSFIADKDDPTSPKGKVKREMVSNAEIWSECFGRNPAELKPADSYALAALMEC